MAQDEHPRPQTTLEQMAKMPTVFKKGGTVTAANASVGLRPQQHVCYGHLTHIPATFVTACHHGRYVTESTTLFLISRVCLMVLLLWSLQVKMR